MNAAQAAPSRPVPFSQFSAEICDMYRASSRRSTVSKMEQALREFGELCPTTADITPHSISRWLSAPGVRRRSVMTRRSILSSFRAACNLGAHSGYLANPFTVWDLDRWLPAPDPEDLERPWLSRSGQEISRVLRRARCEARGGRWRARRTEALIYLAAYTGARAKELLGAQTPDVDLGNGLFHIRNNQRRTLKTRRSRRTLPIHPELAVILKLWMPDCGLWLIPQRSGRGPWFHGSPGYRPCDVVQELGERVAVEGLTLSSFRHTFATSAEGWGWGELEVQRWLGHTQPRTQRWYRHRNLALLCESVSAIHY